jgi:hypothetical protein
MQIKECNSSEIVLRDIKQKLEEIKIRVQPNYKKELCTYQDFWCIVKLAEKEIHEAKVFGFVIHRDIEYKDMVLLYFSNRELEIHIKDPFIYGIVKEEFTEFAEINKGSLKSICFIKDY